MLKNPSFEGITSPGGWTRKTHSGFEFGEIFVPEGWTAWWAEMNARRPEMKVIHKEVPFLDPPRILDGEWAVQAFVTYGRINAGLYQVVEGLEAGKMYRLTAHAHAWSTHPGLQGEDDAHCSAGVGCGPVYIPEGEAPPLNGDPENDAIGNFTFRVGIGFGEEPDPWGPVAWGQGAHIYNGYFVVPQALFVAPTSGCVVIYLKATSLWEFRTSDAYWDHVTLEQIGGSGVPPREQYDRTYILLPQTSDEMTAIEWRTAAAIATAKTMRTIGHSADDAGIGPLSREVIAVNPASWTGNADDLRDFYNQYYAGITYIPIEAGTPWEMGVKLLPALEGDIALGQNWPEWADYDFGEHPGGGTFSGYGCLVTGLGIILRKVYHRAMTPPVLDKLLVTARSAYVSDDILVWQNAVDLFPVFDDYIKEDFYFAPSQLAQLLSEGWEVILRTTGGAHFVYLERVEGSDLHIVDTWDGVRKIKSAGDYTGVRAAHVAVTIPPPPPSAPAILSFHAQGWQGELDNYLTQVQPAAIKLVEGMERAHRIKELSPNTLVIFRHVVDDQEQYLGDPDPNHGARRYLATFLQSLFNNAEVVDYVESLNEIYATNDPDLERSVRFDVAFCEELEREGYPAHPIVLTAPVGNPQHGEETRKLIPAVRAVIEAEGVLGYHAYFGCRPGYCTMDDAWQHYAGRALVSWDPEFRVAGLYPRYIFTECGAVGISPEGHMNPGAGWRHEDCLDEDWETYLALLLEFRRRVTEWNVQHGNRVVGTTLFTVEGPGWDYFNLKDPEIAAMIQALA